MEVVAMSYTSKRNIVSILAGVALIVAYIIYATGANAPSAEDIKAWAVAILVFVGIGIGVQIVVQIVFHIVLTIGIAIKEELKTGNKDGGKTAERILESEMVEDERVKMIGLKASRVGYVFVGLGAFAALVALAVGLETVIALHLLFGLSAFAAVAEGFASIIMSEWGMKQR